MKRAVDDGNDDGRFGLVLVIIFLKGFLRHHNRMGGAPAVVFGLENRCDRGSTQAPSINLQVSVGCLKRDR